MSFGSIGNGSYIRPQNGHRKIPDLSTILRENKTPMILSVLCMGIG